MELHVHLYVHDSPECATGTIHDLFARVLALEAKVETMNAQVQQVVDDLAALRAKVTAITNVSQAVVTTLQGFSAILAGVRQQLADLIANGNLSAEDKATLVAAHDTIKQLDTETGAGAQRMADAITANPAQ